MENYFSLEQGFELKPAASIYCFHYQSELLSKTNSSFHWLASKETVSGAVLLVSGYNCMVLSIELIR